MLGYSLNVADTTKQNSDGKAAANSAAQGGVHGMQKLIAFPGSTLKADAGGGIPVYVWLILAGAAVAVALILRRK